MSWDDVASMICRAFQTSVVSKILPTSMAAHVRLSYEGARNHAALISDALIRKFALGFLKVWKICTQS